MSEMEKNESIERFTEGLLKAASRARELGKAQKNSAWQAVATQLDMLRSNGLKMYKAKGISRQVALDMLDRREQKMGKEAN